MGQSFDAICDDCKHRFNVSEGGGFFFVLLHCEQCGEAHSIDLATLYSEESSVSTKAEHIKSVAGQCPCGGSFNSEANPRCPQCRSDKYQMAPDTEIILYD